MAWVVVLDDGETYGSIEGAVTMEIPDGLEPHQEDEYVKHWADNSDRAEPVVPVGEILDSVRIALQNEDIPETVRIDVMLTVTDFVTNHYA